MTLIFGIVVVAAALLLQRWMLKNCLNNVSADYWPAENLVEPEEVFQVVISLKNNKKWYIPYLKVQTAFPQELLVKIQKSTSENNFMKNFLGKKDTQHVTWSTWLGGYQEAQFRIPISISERGLYILPHPVLFGGDFLGTEEVGKRLTQFREIIAVPKEAKDAAVEDLLGSFLGDWSVQRFLYEDPVLTVGYREYTGYEPMKMISWKQSVRGKGLMVKTYDHTMEQALSVLLNVETRDANREEVLESCFSAVRTVCRILEEKGISYNFHTNAVLAGNIWDKPEICEGLGEHHFLSVLECLGRATYRFSFSGSRLLEKEAERTQMTRGRILITPEDALFEEDALTRLGNVSENYLLIMKLPGKHKD